MKTSIENAISVDISSGYTIIISMVEMKMTEKETQRLKDWKRWGLLMKMLRAIHVEIEPKKQALRHAFD